jgi:polysaccharide biosynthesis/export protein
MPHPVVLFAVIAMMAQTAGRGQPEAPRPAPPAPARAQSAPQTESPSKDGPRLSGHVLGPGDSLTYEVTEDKEVGLATEPKQLKVQSDGTVDVPILGPVPAWGKTLIQLQADIKKRLEAEFYQTATVRMSLTLRAGSIYVLGEVGAPGRREIPADEVFTLARAIAAAGGIGKFGNDRKVELRRKKPDGTVDVTLHDFKKILKGQPEDDVEVRHEDIIFVPSKLIVF